ncbi:hypothetical protein COB52_02485 [Candidatus Kaiserbacteria bacterium]|nr:MAG: hypothetical protein COB52_02485 [Candidatus Kaiserbacteria bacterium]
MKSTQILSALENVSEVIKQYQIQNFGEVTVSEAQRHLQKQQSVREATSHVLWMNESAKLFVENNSLNKAQRWLSFGQGVAWNQGLSSIDDFRHANMPSGVLFAK